MPSVGFTIALCAMGKATQLFWEYYKVSDKITEINDYSNEQHPYMPKNIVHIAAQYMNQAFDARFGVSLYNKPNELDKMQLISSIAEAEFKESCEWIKNAWRALDGSNIDSFKKYISKAYDKATAAKCKIKSNPHDLLGVYSIIIFCGFCETSNFGDNIIEGLKHINNTLNDLNSELLIVKNLKKIFKSKIYWNKENKEFLKNVALFSIEVRRFVKYVIMYTQQNVQEEKNDNQKTITKKNDNEKTDEEKTDEEKKDEEKKEEKYEEKKEEKYEEVKDFFESLNLHYYHWIFDENGCESMNDLKGLKLNKIKELGVHNHSDAKTIAAAIEKYFVTQNYNEEKYEFNKKFGTMIQRIFPNSKFDESKINNDHEKLLNYTLWCPNIFSGKYLGGDQGKKYKIIDFIQHIYPLIFDQDELELSTFIDVYVNELALYLTTTNHIFDDIKKCIPMYHKNGDDYFVQINEKSIGKNGISISLALHEKINELTQKNKNTLFSVPNELIVNGYDEIFDKIIISRYFAFTKLTFDGVDEDIIFRFCYLLHRERQNQQLPTLSMICVKNMEIRLEYLNMLLVSLTQVCIGIKKVIFDSLKIRYKLYGDNPGVQGKLNLDLLPTTINAFEHTNIMPIGIDNKNIINENDLKANENDLKVNESESIWTTQYKLSNSEKNQLKLLRTINMNNTILSKFNMEQLFVNFIPNQCNELTEISLMNCGLNDELVEIIKHFYEVNSNHKLKSLKLSNKFQENIQEKIKNKLGGLKNKLDDIIDNKLENVSGNQNNPNMGNKILTKLKSLENKLENKFQRTDKNKITKHKLEDIMKNVLKHREEIVIVLHENNYIVELKSNFGRIIESVYCRENNKFHELSLLDKSKSYSCKECNIDIALENDIESKNYTVKSGNGRGYLFANGVNIFLSDAKTVKFTTGCYEIKQASCVKCSTQIGWKYISAKNILNNAKRVGKYCLARDSLTSPEEREPATKETDIVNIHIEQGNVLIQEMVNDGSL